MPFHFPKHFNDDDHGNGFQVENQQNNFTTKKAIIQTVENVAENEIISLNK